MKTDDEGEVEALYSAITLRPVTLFVVVLLAPHLSFSPLYFDTSQVYIP